MQQKFTQRLEMQIPQQNTYPGATTMSDSKEKLETFLNQNFKFPSDNFKEIANFINKDNELKKLIYALPNEISSKFPYNEISLNFMKETDPSEKILEIVILSDLDEKILLEKEDLLSDEIIDKYPKTILEYIILVEPYD